MTQAPASPEEFERQDVAALLAYLLKLGVHFDDAQDVAAETVKRMWERWSSVTSPRAWARATALHIVIDAARRARADQEKQHLHRIGQSATSPSADELFMLNEQQRAVVEHIRNLPTRQRNIFALHLDGFTNAEIAEMLSINRRTVASHLRHAKQRLRTTLEADGIYTPATSSTKRGD